MNDSIEILRLQQRFNLLLMGVALAVPGFGFAWLGYVDAPVSELAVALMAAATLLASGTVLAAAAARECAIRLVTGSSALIERRQQRAQRLTMACLVLTIVLTGMACCLTASLKQVDEDQGDQTDTTVLHS